MAAFFEIRLKKIRLESTAASRDRKSDLLLLAKATLPAHALRFIKIHLFIKSCFIAYCEMQCSFANMVYKVLNY